MAHGQKHKGGKTAGSPPDPTRASKPHKMTYRFQPNLYRGVEDPSRGQDADGNELPLTGYGHANAAVPSSVGVKESDRLADIDIDAPDQDAALQSLKDNGHGDSSGENNCVADLQRKINTDSYPLAHGMAVRSSRGGGSETVPGAIIGDEGEPERQP